MNIQEEELLDIPITERILEVKPPPPPPPAPEVIEIVADEKEIEETILESTETDESEYVEVLEMDDIDEVVEDLISPFDGITNFITCQGDDDDSTVDKGEKGEKL